VVALELVGKPVRSEHAKVQPAPGRVVPRPRRIDDTLPHWNASWSQSNRLGIRRTDGLTNRPQGGGQSNLIERFNRLGEPRSSQIRHESGYRRS
jgi:hypothetical protein